MYYNQCLFIVVSGSFPPNQISCSFVFLSLSFEIVNCFEKDPEATITRDFFLDDPEGKPSR